MRKADGLDDVTGGGRVDENSGTVRIAREQLSSFKAQRKRIIDGEVTATPRQRSELATDIREIETQFERLGVAFEEDVAPSNAVAPVAKGGLDVTRAAAVANARQRLGELRTQAREVALRPSSVTKRERERLRLDISALEIALLDAGVRA